MSGSAPRMPSGRRCARRSSSASSASRRPGRHALARRRRPPRSPTPQHRATGPPHQRWWPRRRFAPGSPPGCGSARRTHRRYSSHGRPSPQGSQSGSGAPLPISSSAVPLLTPKRTLGARADQVREISSLIAIVGSWAERARAQPPGTALLRLRHRQRCCWFGFGCVSERPPPPTWRAEPLPR